MYAYLLHWIFNLFQPPNGIKLRRENAPEYLPIQTWHVNRYLHLPTIVNVRKTTQQIKLPICKGPPAQKKKKSIQCDSRQNNCCKVNFVCIEQTRRTNKAWVITQRTTKQEIDAQARVVEGINKKIPQNRQIQKPKLKNFKEKNFSTFIISNYHWENETLSISDS